MNAFDKKGIPILPGDTLKVFHYIATMRREKRYMYKYVERIEERLYGNLLRISHLNLKNEWYYLLMDDKIYPDIEIVQGYGGVESGQDYRDRKRKK